MFGRLVSTDFEQCTLEYIENSDPATAFNRNLQDKIRVACMLCRSRKARCSGGGERCQRCIAMRLKCVYPKNRGRNKRQENSKSNQTVTQRDANILTRIVCDEMEHGARNNQLTYGEELTFDDLPSDIFNDGYIDEDLVMPWMIENPMQHSLDGGSSSSSSGIQTPAVDLTVSESSFPAISHSISRSTTVTPPGQLPKSSAADTSLASLLGPLATESLGDLGSWEESHMAHGDISRAINVVGLRATGSTPDLLSLEPQGKIRTESDSCCCLLSSVSFLERLASRSASREDRIDLLLAHLRNSIETLAAFVACERCEARVEQNMLLAMAARQISVVCEKMASYYKAFHLSCQGPTNSSIHNPELNASAGFVDILVSTYRVNQYETLHLLGSLIALQIVEFRQHFDVIKSRYRNRPSQGQAEVLTEAENHIKLAQTAIDSQSTMKS